MIRMVNESNGNKASSSTAVVPSTQVFDQQSKSELLAHIQLLLSSYGFHKTANELIREIEANGLVPMRYDINGVTHQQNYSRYIRSNESCATNFIEMLKRLNELSCAAVPPVVPNMPIRLFASKRQSMVRRADVLTRIPRLVEATCSRPSMWTLERINTPSLLMARQLGGQLPHPCRIMLRKESMADLSLHKRIFGHLGPIFCVKFDMTGRYIFTGADDNLIKVWDAQTCLLRYTFRGHTNYIMDMAVSPENNILASGSMDKSVRMWCLQRGKLLHCNKGHTASITTIAFLPFMKGNTRYLVSSGSDCSVFFFRYEAPNHFRGTPPIVFNERTKSGVKLVSLCYSPGGTLVALGDTHQCIRLYQVSENNVERLFQVPTHTDRVDSLIWAHKNLRFVSGSKDGTAKAWFIGEKGWCSTSLKMPKTLTGAKTNSPPRLAPYQRMMPDGRGGYVMQTVTNHGAHNQLRTKKNSYRVTMLCWTRDDDVVVSSGSDNQLRTWNWRTGDQLRLLSGHTDEAFVLLAHPLYREYVLSVGHDAKLIVWDVYTGKAIKIYRNDSDNEANEKRAIFDMSISPNGTLVSFVDNYGNLSVLGVNSNEPAGRVPREQFFNTDYRSFLMDDRGFIIDELTGLAPHNMDPPVFVSSDGAPHAEEWQRRVPGNDLNFELVCPWLKREIVSALTETEQQQVVSEWEVVHEAEMRVIDNLPNAIKVNESVQIDPENRQLVVRQRKTPGTARNISPSAAHIAHLEQLRSQYVIDGDDDSDNDPSYTAGDNDSRRGAGSPGVEEDEPEDDDEADSEYEDEPPMAPYSSAMQLRNGGRRLPHLRRLRGGLGDSDEGQGHSSDTQPVRRSRRHLPAGYASTSPGASPLSEAPVTPPPPPPQPTARQTRVARRTAAKNVRATSRSSKENASASNEDEPCCSRTLTNPTDSEATAEEAGEGPSSSCATTSSSAAVTTTIAAKDESSAGEECHESDNTYKDDSPSSHADEEEEEEEEEEPEAPQPSRSQRNNHYAYSPPTDEPILSTPTESSASSLSSSSCYSSGKKARRPPPKGRRRAKTGESSSRVTATPRAVVKRKATQRGNASEAEAKRPRRAAANNALNRFRQSSDFEDNAQQEDEAVYMATERTTRRAATRVANSARDNSDSPVRRRRNARRIRSSSEEDRANNQEQNMMFGSVIEPSTSSSTRPRRHPLPKSLFPPRTRTGRRVIPTVRYNEDD